MVQMVDRSHMGHLMKMRQQDAVHKDPQIALQGEDVVAQAIALLHQVKTKEGIQGTRGGGHQHLHLLLQQSSATDFINPNPRPKRRGHRRSHPAWKRSRRMEKFKEGGKNVTFLSYDGTYGATDHILGFIQQFDSAFGGEYFEERSKLRHVGYVLPKVRTSMVG